MPKKKRRIFVSHGWIDRWVAEQIARRLQRDCGCETFIDVFDVEKGDDIEERVFAELPACQEIVVLFTPWSAERNWLWVEIGCARSHNLRIVAVLYGTTLEEIDRAKGGKTFLGSKNVVDINELEDYFKQAKARAKS